jgi:hypothetical protein
MGLAGHGDVWLPQKLELKLPETWIQTSVQGGALCPAGAVACARPGPDDAGQLYTQPVGGAWPGQATGLRCSAKSNRRP